jgi:hypothetical protein
VSIVSSLGAAVYAGLIGRTHGLVQRTTTGLRVGPERPGSSEGAAVAGEGSGGQEPPGAGEGPDAQEPPGAGALSGGRRARNAPAGWPWRRSVVVVGVAALIFAIAIGAVTGIEAVIKEPIATALGVRARGQARTSLGVAVDRASGSGATRPSAPSSSTLPPAGSQPGQAPPTTEPGSSGPAPSTTTGGGEGTEGSSGTRPPSSGAPTTTQPSASTSGGTSLSR